MTSTIITLPMSQDTFDELSLLLGVDPTRFTDPELAERLQDEISGMQETLLREVRPDESELATALQRDIETGLVTLASISR